MNKTAQSVWENCLSFIKDNIQEQAYKTWFEPIKAIELSGNVLHIQVPSKFFYEWLEEHYVKLLKLSLTRSEEHTSELQSRPHLVCRLLLEKKNKNIILQSIAKFASIKFVMNHFFLFCFLGSFI